MKCLFDKDRPHFATWLWIYNEDSQGRSISTQHPEAPDAGPLYYAAMLGFRNLAKHLIAKRPRDVNDRGRGKVTPLHVAVSAGHLDILSLLLDRGADADGRDRLWQTPLHRMEKSKLGNVYLIVVRISRLEITIAGPHCSMRRSKDI
jgi:hypothetical protein